MLGEYKVNRCTRQCHALGRPLREGEWYYSIILEAGEDYIRQDFSAEAWTGPPAAAVGWWKKRMPTADEKKLILAPAEVLIDLLRQMGQFPAKAKSRYLLALMLMRRRIVRPVRESTESPIAENSIRVEVIADGCTIDVPICEITRSEADTLRNELNELLYCEATPEDE